MVKPGQIWENGKAAVKLQDSESGILAVTFVIRENRSLQFSHTSILDEESTFQYVTSLGCRLTDKVLSLEN